MSTRTRETPLPSWTATIGRLADAAIPVRAICERARCTCIDIDLVALAERVGRDYSLVGRRCRCRAERCGGWVHFHYYVIVFRPLWTWADVDRWSAAELARLRAGGAIGSR